MKFIKLLLFINVLVTINIIGQDMTTSIPHVEEETYLINDWNWALEIPIWIPGFRGGFAYGDVSLEGEDGIDPGTPTHPIEPPSPGEPPVGGGNILSRLFNSSKYLKFFFVGQISYKQDKFLGQIDAVSGTIGQSVEFVLNKKEVATGSYATIISRLIIGYLLYEVENKPQTNRFRLYGYTGMRMHYFELFSNLNRTSRNLDVNNFLGEAVLGIQSIFALKDWLFLLKADIGSFYTGNNSSYMINFYCQYRISNLLSAKLGWSDWDVKYKGDVRDEELSLNVHLSGPNMGLAFHF